MTRIAIIGAGASGLSALKYALEVFGRDDVEDELEVCVFEKQLEVGGVWYDDHTQKEGRVLVEDDGRLRVVGDDVSPMYDGLRTNLPHDLMSFRDHVFPTSTPTFPTADKVQDYLVSYADRFDLRRHIHFGTTVTRLYKPKDQWVIESSSPQRGYETSYWDKIVVANGHYADTHIPLIPGLSTFPGSITHSRFYRSPKTYLGQKVLIVGSFASGSDLARQIASLNLDPENALTPTKVYVSSSGDTSYAPRDGDWAKFVVDVPIITRVDGKVIEFEDARTVDDVDVVIFATGYYYALPFCKAVDGPWKDVRVLDEEIGVGRAEGQEQANGGAERKGLSNGNAGRENGLGVKNGDHGGIRSGVGDVSGGIRGFHMDNLDPLLLFLRTDRSIAFPTLQYQVVPFPLAETQSRLLALLWSGLLPNFPPTSLLKPPINPANPYAPASDDQTSPSGANGAKTKGTDGTHGKAVRKVVSMRREFVFGHPYEWSYEEYIMGLCFEADGGGPVEEDGQVGGDGGECGVRAHGRVGSGGRVARGGGQGEMDGKAGSTPAYWRGIEDWRRARRSDTGLRKKTLGY